MCVLLPSGETRNYINIRKERSRLWDHSQTHSMKVDDGDDCQPPTSPISYREDKLLTGGNAVGVEEEITNLKVSSPGGYDGSDGSAST